MADDQKLIIRINGDIKGYQDALKEVSKESADLQKQLSSIAKVSGVAFLGFGAAIALTVKEAAKFETIGTQFEVLTGSVAKATKLLKDLADFSASTPFQFEDIAKAGKKLLGFQVSIENIKPTLKSLGDVAASTGADFGELSLIFGQVKAAGKLTGERLLQLQERAIPIGPALAKTMGVAETSISSLVTKGKIDFATFEKAFKSLSEKGGIAFEGMAKNSKTLEGQISTLKDNFSLAAADIGKEFLPVAKEIIGAMIGFFQVLRSDSSFGKFVSKALIAGTVATGLTVSVSLLAIGFLKLRAGLIASTLATKGLSFAVKGLVGATGIGLLVAFLPEILELFDTVFTGAKNIVEKTGGAIGKAVSSLGGILKGLFTFDMELIKKSFVDFKTAFSEVSEATIQEFTKTEKAIVKSEKVSTKAVEDGSAAKIAAEKKAAEEKAKIEADKADKEKKALEDRKTNLKIEQEVLKASNQGLEKEQVAFLQRKLTLENEAVKASQIKSEEERNLAVENVKLKNQQLLNDELAFAAKKEEIREKEKTKNAEKVAKDLEDLESRRQVLLEEQELLVAARSGMETEEIGFLSRHRELINESAEADLIADEEEMELSLQNLILKNELLLEEETLFFERRDELNLTQATKEAAIKKELETLSKKQRDALNKEDLKFLATSFKTKSKIESEQSKAIVLKQRADRDLFLKDELKHGTTIAKIKKFQRSSEMGNAQTAATALSGLQKSENANAKAIGKAAAITQIGIDTQKAAVSAFSSLSGIPIVGPALGAVAAAAVILFGLDSAKKVQAAQAGGLVGGTGFGDSVPFLLEPGELITPRQNFEEVVNAVSDSRRANDGETVSTGDDEDETGSTQFIEIGFDSDEAADMLTIKQNESSVLGFSEAI